MMRVTGIGFKPLVRESLIVENMERTGPKRSRSHRNGGTGNG